MTETSVVEVGRFTYDTSTQEVTGPAEYVRERLHEYLAEVNAGRHQYLWAFAPEGQSFYVTLLVGVQTDYAGWVGSRSYFQEVK